MTRGEQLDGEQGAVGSTKNQNVIGGGHLAVSRYETRGWGGKAEKDEGTPFGA
jgi:hypothetical protein